MERGISLNSARSVLDHLEGDDIEIIPVYYDYKRKPYRISKAQLYSNTPSDFDFKLHQSAVDLTEPTLVKLLRTIDIVFPVMHGPFGEDGGIQAFLEKHKIPFIGSGSVACKKAFDKFIANQFLRANGFYTMSSVVLKIYHKDHHKIVSNFFGEYKITRAIVKPASGGSSIGVFSVSTIDEAIDKTDLIFSKRMDTRVVIEPFATGKEFTVIVLQNRFNLPVAIIPTEIETDYKEHQIFDFRKKYLPTRQVAYHCPPRFSTEIIERIQNDAEQIFTLFGMKDFGRFDGWVLPDGRVWFCDLNPISGMEQNSFLFQQASRVGFSHKDILRYILRHACHRYNIPFPVSNDVTTKKLRPVHVLFGGKTSERQVSLMSGTNAWLKLKRSKHYTPKPFLLDLQNKVWELPYALTLNHTVEEIAYNCARFRIAKKQLGRLEQKVKLRLGLVENDATEELFQPQKMTLAKFAKISPFVFIGLHGGLGEDGTMQKLLKKYCAKFNGSDELASKLCLDKWSTSKFIENLRIDGLRVPPGKLVDVSTPDLNSDRSSRLLWKRLRRELEAETLIVKPRADGCSSGVVHLFSPGDLVKYVDLLKKRTHTIPKNTFRGQTDIVEMPLEPIDDLLFEKFITTDAVRVKNKKLKYVRKTGWVEITVGLLEENKEIRVLNPSITIAEGEVLTVEEKFQGGTGVNLTPPPESIVHPKAVNHTKDLVEKLARAVGMRGYGRIDAFMHVKTGNLIVIEVNTLPGLTPSTVLFHQALAETPPIFPSDFLERLIENKGY